MKPDSKFKTISLLVAVVFLTQACDRQPKTITTDEGLVIETMQRGEGAEAGSNSYVTVHYTGWLYDDTKEDKKGTQFDSSRERDSKFSFILGQGRVIKGWEQGVTGMRVGDQRRLTIPPELAYGERAVGGVIPANSTLLFEVELFDVDNLEVIDNKVGNGTEAINGTKVSVHYTGWLYDENADGFKGAQFDSSVERGNQFSFVLGARGVIAGWDAGVIGMKVGGQRTLIIPSAMAYGKRGSGKNIPPDSKLIFDVELFEVDTGALQ